MQEQNVQTGIVSYRNAIYHGEVKTGKRHGKGVLIMDDGLIMVGSWKTDTLYGPAFAFINSEQYAFLQFNRGDLEGYCYFRNAYQMSVIKFSSGRAVDRQLIANFEEHKIKISTYRNANYELLQTHQFQNSNESAIVEKYLGLHVPCPTLIQYLQSQFCNHDEHFELKLLPNGQHFFKYIEKSQPVSVGFVLDKKDQLASYGSYLYDKLHGFGCKYQNNAKYEGQFENGFLNGLGMRFSNNKYSFGQFENGNLTEALFLEERSKASEEKLRDLRRVDHIQSPNFLNAYVRKDLLHFRGISQINSMSTTVKEYLYSQFIVPEMNTMKGSTVSLNQYLSTKVKEGQNKVIMNQSRASRPRNPQDNTNFWSQRRPQDIGVSQVSATGRKFNY